MDQSSRKHMLKAVPRYTSYPTIPHFEELAENTYSDWLANLDSDEPISLYLHVPFCKKLCWYCACNMKLASRYQPIAEYVDHLIREIDLVSERLPARMKVSHLHWGGGTPTALCPDDLKRVMEHLAKRFDILPLCEKAIEIDPRTLEDEMVTTLGALEFNRVSFGVQEFSRVVQKAINRIQPYDMVADCVAKLRGVGIEHVNFDLIYGLPMQTTQMIENTIKLCAKIRPGRLALFGYAHVPWMAKKQRLIDADTLPGLDERHELAKTAGELLKQEGYQAIGFDHYALPEDALSLAARRGTLCRNFQGFTTDQARTLIGFGTTSIGKTPQGFVQNLPDTTGWARQVRDGRLPIAKGKVLSPSDKMRAEIIDSLMCRGRVDLEKVFADHAETRPSNELFELGELIKDGLVQKEREIVSLTPQGEALVRVVCTAFDEYFNEDKNRHSLAV